MEDTGTSVPSPNTLRIALHSATSPIPPVNPILHSSDKGGENDEPRGVEVAWAATKSISEASNPPSASAFRMAEAAPAPSGGGWDM